MQDTLARPEGEVMGVAWRLCIRIAFFKIRPVVYTDLPQATTQYLGVYLLLLDHTSLWEESISILIGRFLTCGC